MKPNQYQHPFDLNKYDNEVVVGNHHLNSKAKNMSNNMKMRKINRSTNLQGGIEDDDDGTMRNSSKALKRNYPAVSSSNGELKKFIHYQI